LCPAHQKSFFRASIRLIDTPRRSQCSIGRNLDANGSDADKTGFACDRATGSF